MVQVVVPSYQLLTAGSMVSQTIRVLEVPSVQAFIFNPVPGTSMLFGSSVRTLAAGVPACAVNAVELHAMQWVMRGGERHVVADRARTSRLAAVLPRVARP